MQLKPFVLDACLDQYEHDIEFNLAASTGPTWTVSAFPATRLSELATWSSPTALDADSRKE